MQRCRHAHRQDSSREKTPKRGDRSPKAAEPDAGKPTTVSFGIAPLRQFGYTYDTHKMYLALMDAPCELKYEYLTWKLIDTLKLSSLAGVRAGANLRHSATVR